MQLRSVTGEYYYPRYFNVGLSGHSWPISQGDITWSNGQNFNVLLPPSTMDHNVGYQKEIFRQMMLKHEATFKYQVYELHRVYGRQKELMEEIRKREILNHNLKPHFVSGLRPAFPFRPSTNLTCIEPSMLSAKMFEGPSYFLQSIPDQHPTKHGVEECELSLSQTNKSRKRMLDLELPAYEYNDSDVDNVVQVPEMPVSKLQLHIDSNLNSFSPRDSSVSQSSCRNVNVLFDLNAPAQPDESDFPTSTILESDKSQHDDHCDRTSGHNSTANFKVSDNRNLPKVVDLNMFPADFSSDDDFSGHTSLLCQSDLLEREDKETDCSGKSGIIDSNLSPNPTDELQEYDRGDNAIDAGLDGKFSTGTVTNLNSDLKNGCAPSPLDQSDTTEAATQRDLEAPVSPENKECSPPRRDSEDDQLERCISSSKLEGGPQEEEPDDMAAADTLFAIASKTTTIEQSEAFSDCLNWFAGIVSSLEDCQQNHVKDMESVGNSLPSRLRRRHKKRKLQLNSFQTEANEDLHSTSRCGRGRGKKQNRCLAVWGKTKRRKMARVAQSIICSPI